MDVTNTGTAISKRILTYK